MDGPRYKYTCLKWTEEADFILISGEVSHRPVEQGYVQLVDGFGMSAGERGSRPAMEATVETQNRQLQLDNQQYTLF